MARVNAPGQSSAAVRKAVADRGPRTTRVTRSASREPPEQPTEMLNDRRTTRRKKLAERQNDGLSTLLEDSPSSSPQRATAEPVASQTDPYGGRGSVVSGVSGMTGLTSFSHEEVDELDHEVMVDVLPSLAHASSLLADLIVPSNPNTRSVIWHEIRTEGQRQRKLFNNRSESVRLHKRSFGSTDYIQPQIVLKALFKTASSHNVPDGSWRPDDILYKVNLTEMLRHLIPIEDAVGSEEAQMALLRLDVAFPSAIAGPNFDKMAFDFALEICVQLCISYLTLTRDESLTADSVIAHTFFAEDAGTGEFKYGEALHLDHVNRSTRKNCQRRFLQVVESVSQFFDDDGQTSTETAINNLISAYPWHRFLEKATEYYEHRNKELTARILAAGGLDVMVQGLATAVEQYESDQIAQAMRQRLSKTTPKKKFGAGAIAALKAREKRSSTTPVSTANVHAGQDALTVESGQMTPPLPAEDDEDEDADANERSHRSDPDASTAQQRAQSTLDQLSNFQAFQRRNADKGKRRAFIDQQSNADRVRWDDDDDEMRATQSKVYPEPGTQVPSPYHQRISGKRSHAEMSEVVDDFEPTQDEGFEIDRRNPTSANERRRATAETTQARRERQTYHPESSRPSSGLVEYSRPSSTEMQRKNPGSAIPPALPALDPDDESAIPPSTFYQHAAIMAKQSRAGMAGPRTPQIRRPWTDEEQNALCELIEDHGTSWAALKNIDNNWPHGPRLERRGPEDMRQKARNMKVTFLRAGSHLPPGWENVALDKKAVDQLRAYGIHYEQQRIRAREFPSTSY